MIRRLARLVAIAAIVFDLAAAWARWRYGPSPSGFVRATIVTVLALIPCALAFAATIVAQSRRRMRSTRGAFTRMRLPIKVPRAYVGAAALGFIGTLAAMGEGFGAYILLAGVVLIALALSQALPGGVQGYARR
ncbi:hypothetical protein [Sphingomonas morindae]|uniref:Uncharacterized protein n=1 Tax=Sphingomonas morindae TaxID=1541170 RepID=A0ABY4X4G2_9SPHN|nr:hypothetical protein [Sphingomonas morindae]USI71746.1 hypothetical protein LHA26_10455 [Sphingomonas morindae]